MTDALNQSNQHKSAEAKAKLIDKIEALEKAFNELIKNPLGELSKCKSLNGICDFDGLELPKIKNRKPIYDSPEIKTRYEALAAKVQSYNPSDSKEVLCLRKELKLITSERDAAVNAQEKLVESIVILSDRKRSSSESLEAALTTIDRLTSQNQKLLKERDELKKEKANGQSLTLVP